MTDPTRLVSETVADVSRTDRHVVVRAMAAGLWIWPSFTILDAYMCFVVYPEAPFRLFVLYRAVIEAAFYLVYRASRRREANVARLFRWQGVCFGATAFAISLMALHLGGVRSPYMHGISIVALVWAALTPHHWRRGLPTLAVIGLSFPTVMGLATVVSSDVRAEWLTAEALKLFAANYVFVLASATVSIILGHMVWTAQQRLRHLGSYRLETLLGQGGMGEVWQARHSLLARRAAIKLIRPEALAGTEETKEKVLARFEREAQATASLRSPHTIQLYDFGISERGAFFYVMELLDGLDLEMLVERHGPLPAERVVHVLRQMCDSLGEAHAAGLVHRDVKPSNVYLCRYGRIRDFVKVLDFGLAKPREEQGPGISGELVVRGTPTYMSPEQILAEGPIDARADLYSLGCVTYWLLTGRCVFQGGSAWHTMLKHVNETPLRPSQNTDNPVPPELDDLVMSCIEKEPDRRPASADALAAILDGVTLPDPWTPERARVWWDGHHS